MKENPLKSHSFPTPHILTGYTFSQTHTKEYIEN